MDELIAYLNSLPRTEQILFAEQCGTTVNYLRRAISANPRPKFDGALARKLDVFSGGKVKKQSLRPDIWPELIAA